MSELHVTSLVDLSAYLEALAEARLRGFDRTPFINPRTGRVEPRVNGEPLPLEWRISSQEAARLVLGAPASLPMMIYGYPVVVDDAAASGRIPVLVRVGSQPDQ